MNPETRQFHSYSPESEYLYGMKADNNRVTAVPQRTDYVPESRPQRMVRSASPLRLDRNLVERVVSFHGNEVMDVLDEEHHLGFTPNPSAFEKREPDLDSDDEFVVEITRFISKKGDILLRPGQETIPSQRQGLTYVEEDYKSILPPVESFMQVNSSAARGLFYENIEKGDIVVGMVTAIQESGLVITLVALDNGKARDIDHLRIVTFCPLREIPQLYAHESPLDGFAIKDLVRGIVLNASYEVERITVSLLTRALLPGMDHIKIGLINEEDLPVYFRRIHERQNRSYNTILEEGHGFNNPANVSYMCETMSLSELKPLSLMRGLQNITYPDSEYAASLRKGQSSKLALKSVESGIIKFKEGYFSEAMVHLNKALQIDTESVEALVARGALYANNENYKKALKDFEEALLINPSHPNAKKYMCETLVVHGRMIEDAGHINDAIDCYERALRVNPNLEEAQNCLHHLQSKTSLRKTERSASETLPKKISATDQHQKPQQDNSELEKISDTLRKLIEDDKGEKHKKKKKRKSSEKEKSPRRKKSPSSEGVIKSGKRRKSSPDASEPSNRRSRRDQHEEEKNDSKERKSRKYDASPDKISIPRYDSWNKLGPGSGEKSEITAPVGDFDADDFRRMARDFALNEKKEVERKSTRQERNRQEILIEKKEEIERRKSELDEQIAMEKRRLKEQEYKVKQTGVSESSYQPEDMARGLIEKVAAEVGGSREPWNSQQVYAVETTYSKMYDSNKPSKPLIDKEKQIFDSFLPMFADKQEANDYQPHLFNEFGDTDYRQIPNPGPSLKRQLESPLSSISSAESSDSNKSVDSSSSDSGSPSPRRIPYKEPSPKRPNQKYADLKITIKTNFPAQDRTNSHDERDRTNSHDESEKKNEKVTDYHSNFFKVPSRYKCLCGMLEGPEEAEKHFRFSKKHKNLERIRNKKLIPRPIWPIKSYYSHMNNKVTYYCICCSTPLLTSDIAVKHAGTQEHNDFFNQRRQNSKAKIKRDNLKKEQKALKPVQIIVKKKGTDLFWCTMCECEIAGNVRAVESHTKSQTHTSNTEKLVNGKKFPTQEELLCVVENSTIKKHFYCKACLQEIFGDFCVEQHFSGKRHKHQIIHMLEISKEKHEIKLKRFLEHIERCVVKRTTKMTALFGEDEVKANLKKSSPDAEYTNKIQMEHHAQKTNSDHLPKSRKRSLDDVEHKRKEREGDSEKVRSRDDSLERYGGSKKRRNTYESSEKRSHSTNENKRRRSMSSEDDSSSDSSRSRSRDRNDENRRKRDSYDDDRKDSRTKYDKSRQRHSPDKSREKYDSYKDKSPQRERRQDSGEYRGKRYEDRSSARKPERHHLLPKPIQPIIKRPGEINYYCNICKIKIFGDVSGVQEHSRDPSHLKNLSALEPPEDKVKSSSSSYSYKSDANRKSKEPHKSKWDTDSEDEMPQTKKVVLGQLSSTDAKNDSTSSLNEMEAFLSMLKQKKGNHGSKDK